MNRLRDPSDLGNGFDLIRDHDYPGDLKQQGAFVRLQQTSDLLMQGLAEVLKPYGISPTQYNALRILRGAAPDGLPCNEVGVRMFSKDPDMTRLLDRLEQRTLVTRTRSKTDRRVVEAAITKDGLAMLTALDEPVRDLHRRQFARLDTNRLKMLLEALDLLG